MDFHRDRDARRQQIEHELVVDPARTNREIARLVGCDHKTVGAIRASANSPKAVGEMVGKNPHHGEIGHDGDISWGDVPDDAYTIPAQGLTSAFLEEATGDLVILQDQGHLMRTDAVIRIGALEVEGFVEELVAMVRRRDQEP